MSEQVTTNAPDPADVGSRIDPLLARSWLLVNGAHDDRFEAAVRSRAQTQFTIGASTKTSSGFSD